MPRKYIKKPGSRKYGYSEEDLCNAKREVNEGLSSITKAAKKYNISKGTLVNKLREKHLNKAGRPLVFSEAEENIFVEHILTIAKWGFPFTTMDLRQLAKMYLDKAGRRVKQLKSNLPSAEWAWRFLERHKNKISQRTCQNLIRSKAELTPEEVKKYFDNLRLSFLQTFSTENITEIPAENIFNYDETNLSDDPGVKKCIFKRGVKYAERVINTSKSSISVMYCGSAAGTILPPYVVYKSSHLWQTWVEGGPRKTRYNRSLSGWFDSVVFTDWFENLFLPETKNINGKLVLIGDNLSSHFTPRVIELAQNKNITFVCIPPNSTHVAQPLDVAFFAPFKKYWRQILDEWKSVQKKRAQILSKEAFPPLLKKLHYKIIDESNKSKNIISGFKKCGIFPFNPNEVIDRLPQASTQIDPELSANIVSEAVIEMLDKSRNEKPEQTNTRKRKKMKVSPGKGITIEALESGKTDTIAQNAIVSLSTEAIPSTSNVKPLETDKTDTIAQNAIVSLSTEAIPSTSNVKPLETDKTDRTIAQNAIVSLSTEAITEAIPSTSNVKKNQKKKRASFNELELSSDEDNSMCSADIPYMDTSDDFDWNLSDEELLKAANKKMCLIASIY